MSDLADRGFALDDDRVAVPEPEVKAALAARGVAVPDGATAPTPAELAAAATALRAPLVLKAFGPGLVHKSDVGAVVLGLAHDGLAAAAEDMAQRLAGHGITPAGFLVEEQQPTGGVELIVGVVQRHPFGPVVALGLGGTLTEVLDQVALRLCPLSEADARDLVRTFPAAAVLQGVRGAPPVDEDALVALLLAVAGPEGLATALGDDLAELECNPVLAGPDGAVALDARLVLATGAPERPPAPPATDFTRLFAPRAVAVAGASANRPGFGNRALAAYKSMGWTEGLYAVHPEASEIDGVPATSSVADLDEAVDYLLVTVPAARCADLVRATEGRVPFVHVVSGGFGEASGDGADLVEGLRAAAREAGTRVIGPNCIGIYSPGGRQAFQQGDPKDEGPISIVSQSGGLAGDIIKGGAQRGLRFSKLATVGNAIDVTPGELVDWLVDDDETKAIGIYLEGSGDARRLVEALRKARGKVPVALLLGGQSAQGAAAVASHTGSLAGDRRIWDAIALATGTTLATTLEDLLAVLTYVQTWEGTDAPDDPGVLILGVGGGASVLATDACDRAGLSVTPTSDEVRRILTDMGYGVGTNLTNPLEIPFGPVVPVDTLRKVLTPVLAAQPFADVLIHINVQAYYSYGSGIDVLLAQLEDLVSGDWDATRLAVVVRNVECAPGADAERLRAKLADAGLPLFRDFDEAATAIAAMKRFTAARAEATRPAAGSGGAGSGR